jgi:hypothetical protein
MNEFVIRSPCHPDSTLFVETRWEGPAYMQETVPDGFSCNAPGCFNQWDSEGNPV